jgi:hypothetical protein
MMQCPMREELLQELNGMVRIGTEIWTEGKIMDVAILHPYKKTMIANVTMEWNTSRMWFNSCCKQFSNIPMLDSFHR